MPTKNSQASPTYNVAKWAAKLEYDDLPQKVVQVAKYCFLDTIGVALAGLQAQSVLKVKGYANDNSSHGTSSIWGSAIKTTAELSALTNGTACHALDYDETNYSSIGHPAAIIVPALLALSEEHQCQGRDLITAFVAGYEVMGKLGATVNPSTYHKGWWTTSLLGLTGAVVACSRLLRIDIEEMVMAIGLGVSFASGLRSNFGTMAKPFGVGKTAMDGVMFSKLAKIGLTTATDHLDADSLFLSLISDHASLNALDDLGKPYELTNPGVAFKLYPSCSATHAAVDAILSLVKEYGFVADDVTSIICEITPLVNTSLIYTNPANTEHARFSLEACVAMALCKGELDNSFFTGQNITDSKLRTVMGRVHRRVRNDFSSGQNAGSSPPNEATRLIVSLNDNQTFDKTVLFAKGNNDNPLSGSELENKFNTVTQDCIPCGKAAIFSRMVLDLESLQDTRDLTDCLCC
ncbi:MmgE/PrpD family protein [Desulfobacula sp.]|uniref:MmgE/PrpD family protein n=1 Tax=Desulfobacula sp. TaxID=2593537 RepID=UPI0026282C93|nr:MmgE/PrpD family protein [Desulfobacula sp.]